MCCIKYIFCCRKYNRSQFRMIKMMLRSKFASKVPNSHPLEGLRKFKEFLTGWFLALSIKINFLP